MITYSEADGDTIDTGNASIPWTMTARYESSKMVVLTAANPTSYGTIICTILLDGRVWKTEEATPPSDKVACAGIVP